MTHSRRTDPRSLRAARRSASATPFRIVVSPPPSGMIHPAKRASIIRFLAHVGNEHTYGLKRIELVGPPATTARHIVFGRLVEPGVIRLYAQPSGVWTLHAVLDDGVITRMAGAGATVDYNADTGSTRVAWVPGGLTEFMLSDVLAHELGHHVLQHESRRPTVRTARTRDHEAYAERFAARIRRSWRGTQGRDD